MHPARTLAWRVGDCDDLTILTCSALRSAKIPCRATFIGWSNGRRGGRLPLRHVFGEAWLAPVDESGPPRWVALETVRPVPFGWDVGALRFLEGERVRRSTIGDPAGVEPQGTKNDRVVVT